MEFEEGGHVMHALKQTVGSANSLDTGHTGRQLEIQEVEALEDE